MKRRFKQQPNEITIPQDQTQLDPHTEQALSQAQQAGALVAERITEEQVRASERAWQMDVSRCVLFYLPHGGLEGEEGWHADPISR